MKPRNPPFPSLLTCNPPFLPFNISQLSIFLYFYQFFSTFKETIISYLCNRFLIGLTYQPCLSAVKVIFLLPKSDHVTLFKKPSRVFYHLSFYHLYDFTPWLHLSGHSPPLSSILQLHWPCLLAYPPPNLELVSSSSL